MPNNKNNPGKRVGQVRKNVPGRGNRSLRNASQFPDSSILGQIGDVDEEVQNEFPDRNISTSKNEAADEAAKYYALIRGAFLLREEVGPSSISQTRRFPFNDSQLEYWRDRMIRALNRV